jgi:hypothetical protein
MKMEAVFLTKYMSDFIVLHDDTSRQVEILELLIFMRFRNAVLFCHFAYLFVKKQHPRYVLLCEERKIKVDKWKHV